MMASTIQPPSAAERIHSLVPCDLMES